ncbi:hypothetical protein QN277_026177 [Acacia crassicarpa]|uniref:Retrotransposon Copia-like N-terminal domain-containing protein n=1 Tax=Acacia crassicarpa TaxID=499986 RepID=A0AAE1JAR9_9FABA|nr:hypothetical protein QN277_026177 [Acacia crassicarpa]
MASLSSAIDSSIGASSLSPTNSLQTISNPFYLHPNENPSLILVSPILTGPNYNSWARAMRMLLLSKNKLGFINRSIPASKSTDSLFSIWERCNMMVLSWLTRSISSSIA